MSNTESGIAIVGMAGRFPKAKNVEEFWRNLCGGVECITFFSDEELASAGDDYPKNDPNYVKARGLLENADMFDAAFFGINPREAQVMDPQHRLFLECAWEALEHSGYDSEKFKGPIGVFGGMSMNTYFAHNLLSRADVIGRAGEYQTMLSNDKDFLPLRVSYKMNLRGPSLNIQTACSTSLVAVCVACENLLNYNCDMALAGAVSIMFPQKRGYLFQQGGISSPDGHCRTFDARAAGTVAGEGVGIVVLKRVEDAIRDRDTIYAVIKGFGVNNDGANKIGYTAPSVEGQANVIATAHAMAEISPETISYVEAHGTATPLGDPVEVEGLTKAFRAGTGKKHFCAIGSVKSNIGHLDAAAGVVGLIKVALSLHHKKLPPTLHFESPNPKIDFANSPFFVNTSFKDWQRNGSPLRAGVSSFGIGGTNSHVVVQEAPELEISNASRPAQLLMLSAKTESALDAATKNLAAHLKGNPEINLADAAYTLQAGRREFQQRRMLVCRDAKDAAIVLESRDAKRLFSKTAGRENPPIVFMFPGQGSQQIDMARGIYENEPLFRQTVDRCAEMLQPHLNCDLRELLFPSPEKADETREQLTRTKFTQPALFVVEYALAKLWMSWGILPEAMIGHSIGEYVAATLAEVWTLADALKLVAARGRMMQELPSGAMLAVRLPENEIAPLLNGHLSLATVNAASLCVISGANDAIAELQNDLAKRNVTCTPLRTSHAFHSLMMEPILEPFTRLVESIERHAPKIPFISNVTGTWISAEDATNPNYWAKHLRQTVRFVDGIGELLKSPERIFLEVGPGKILGNLTRQHSSRNPSTSVVSSLPQSNGGLPDEELLLEALGQLWLNGISPDWQKFYSREQRQRIALPTYPFEQKRFWVEPAKSAQPFFMLGVETVAEKEQPVEIKPARAETSATQAGENEIISRLKTLLSELSGMDLSEMDSDTTFVEMGFDSLFLTNVSLGLEKRFGARVAFRQLLEEYSSLNVLAAHIESNLSGEKISDAVVADELPKTETNAVVTVPITEGQRELWLATQMDAETSAAYNECRLLHLRGNLQPEHLVKAIQSLVNRHEALRTTILAAGDSQNIRSAIHFEVTQFDLASLAGNERVKKLDELQMAEARQPFDLVNGPLMRATLIRLAENHHTLILTFHHIICDGHAFGVLLRDLAKIYSAICSGEEIKLPEPLQLSEYARAKLQADEIPLREKSKQYWLEKFYDGAPALELPTDFPRREIIFEGGCETRLLPTTLVRELKNISAQHNSTLFVTLLGAFNVFLYRLTAQNNIVVGVPIADRNLPGADIMAGHCVNFLPMRQAIEEKMSFDEFLFLTKKNFLEAHEHQHCTLGSLLQKLNLPRESGRMPLVSVTFNVDQLKGKLEFTGVEAGLANNPHSYVNFDLGVNLMEIDGGLQMDCRYNAGLFSAETIQRWLGHFQTLLESIIKNAGQRVSDLSMLSKNDRERILVEWNATQMDFPREKCIHQLFEDQAEKTPDTAAIIFQNDGISYRDLNLRAEAIREQLRALGVGPNVPVGICMERSPDMVAAMLGVLKAGGAYVPLDPNYPQDRVAFMLEDSRAPVLLTQSEIANSGFQIPASVKVVCVDEINRQSANGNGRLPEHSTTSLQRPTSNDLAYVIYTSGSTGVPKGVAIEHRNAVNFISWAQKTFSAEEFSAVLAATSICFDLSIFEIFATLCSGGKVILAKNALELPSLPRKNEVRLINTVPSAIRELLRINGVPESVRVVNLAGEPLPAQLADRIYEQTRVEKVFDLYGPSETTTYSTFTLRERGGRATIGKPLANTQIYILDQNLQPVPIGVPGEIFIGGDGVARGYLHREDLTAERFLPNPFAKNSRIYKTGDIARWLADGNIEYLGRGDRQVKIRGFRIELGEIESAIAKHPAVRECVVLAREDSPGDKRLAAYIVQNADQIATAADLRNFLEGKLPEYMVPIFVFLDAMPLTPNGKINKRALPAPQASEVETIETFVEPATPTEETLAKIWSDILRVGKIGARDNFFELGGHSLLVTQVVSRIRETFQIEMTMREFFNAPTISSLAATIEDTIVEQVSRMSDEQINRLNDGELALRNGENSPCSEFLDEGINRR